LTQLSATEMALQTEPRLPTTSERTAIWLIRLIPGMKSAQMSDRIRSIIHGSSWTLAGYGISQVLRLVSQIVLAHLLIGPSAFGLVALVTVFLSGLEMLSDLGIGLDVVQHVRGDDPKFINTAFLIQAARGVILFLIAAALAYPFAAFYHQPAARPLIFVAAISILVRGFSSSSLWTMLRHLELKKLTLLTIGSEIVGLVVSLGWIYISPTAWALVVGRVASAIALAFGSHKVSTHKVTREWDSVAAKSILLFGTGIFLSTATYFFGGEAERLVIGKFISVAELGCFSLAVTLSAAPSRAIQQVVGQVFFPVMATNLRDDREAAARHYRSTRWVFLIISIVLGTAFIAYSHRLVVVLLPPKYLMAGWMLQLLGFRAAQEVFAAPTSSLILACGSSRYAAFANTTRLILMLAGVWFAFAKFGIREGIEVLAFVPALSYLVLLPGVARHLRKALWPELVGLAIFAGAMILAALLPWPWR
jgi:O-antigen/teichoic acid export membrane protein